MPGNISEISLHASRTGEQPSLSSCHAYRNQPLGRTCFCSKIICQMYCHHAHSKIDIHHHVNPPHMLAIKLLTKILIYIEFIFSYNLHYSSTFHKPNYTNI